MRRFSCGSLLVTLWLSVFVGVPGEASAESSDSTENASEAESATALAEGARELRRQGHLIEAGWSLQRAITLDPTDPLAREEATVFGWEGIGSAALEETSLRPVWPWWLAGILMFVAFGIAALRLRDWLGLSALLLGALVTSQLISLGPIERPGLPEPLSAVHEGLSCPATPLMWRQGALTLELRCRKGSSRWSIVPTADAPEALGRSTYHAISYAGRVDEATRIQMVEGLKAAITTAEQKGYRVAPSGPHRASRLERWRGSDPEVQAKRALAAGLVVAALWVVFGVLAGMGIRGLQTGGSAGTRATWLPLGFAAIALIAVPGSMRMVYGGYDLTAHLIDGVIPRYGPGALWFYGPALWWGEADHLSIQRLNRLYGVGCIGLTVALGARWFPNPNIGRVTAWLCALLPVLWVASSCESIHVGPALVLMASLYLATSPHRGRPVPWVSVAFAWLAGALTRPEIAVMALLAPWLILWLRQGRGEAQSAPSAPAPSGDGRLGLGLVVSAALAFIVVSLWDVSMTTREMVEVDAVSFGPELFWKVINAGLVASILVLPTYTPTALPLLLLVGVFGSVAERDERRRAAGVLIFSLVWMGLSGVDHERVSLPRIQLIPLLLCLPVGAWVFTRWWSHTRRQAMVVAVLFVLGALYSGATLFTPSNEDTEETLWREASEALPPGPLCVVSVGSSDPARSSLTPRHSPSYLITAHGSGRVARDLNATREVLERCEGEVYALLGTRCYAELTYGPREERVDGALEVCARFREAYALEPIIERAVVSRGGHANVDYGDAKQLSLGLYRVAGQAGHQ